MSLSSGSSARWVADGLFFPAGGLGHRSSIANPGSTVAVDLARLSFLICKMRLLVSALQDCSTLSGRHAEWRLAQEFPPTPIGLLLSPACTPSEIGDLCLVLWSLPWDFEGCVLLSGFWALKNTFGSLGKEDEEGWLGWHGAERVCEQ